MRKKVSRVAISMCAAASMVLSVVAPAMTVAAETTDEPVELTVWSWDKTMNGTTFEVADSLDDDVTVNFVEMAKADCLQKIHTVLASGVTDDLPDIVLISDLNAQGYLMSYPDAFLPMDDYISYDDLRYIKVLHYNFRHQIQVGELVVNQAIAEDCRQIFMELFQEEYEINSMYLIDRYYEKDQARNGEQVDISSINDDNTSAFHYRKIAGTEVLSNHAYGMAIDINPLENPYVKEADLQQTVASPYKDYNSYKDRTAQRAHMISKDDACYRIFKAHGFQWGGEWNGNKDYQHFEKDR